MASEEQVYTPAHVANFFLSKAQEEGREIDPLKLQKLVYIGYGWVLAVLERRLFSEAIEAWDHGPVVPSLYHEFKHYRWRPIDAYAIDLDWEHGDFVEPHIPPEDERVILVLQKVWDIYKRFTGWALRNKTHEDDTPWSRTYDSASRRLTIPDETIGQHFKRKITEYLDAVV